MCALWIIVQFFGPLSGLVKGKGDYYYGNAFRVRIGLSDRDKGILTYHLLGLAFVFGVFGGLHCIPWNFRFPSEFLRTTWRAMSMILIISPMLTLILARMEPLIKRFYTSSGRSRRLDHVYIAIISGVLYALARIGLLVEAAYLLRDMPDSAFHVVDWMFFLPHL